LEIKEKLGALEAVLFAGGEPVEFSRLSEATGIDIGTLHSMIGLLNERYQDCESGIRIIRIENSYQMCTAEKYDKQIRTALEKRKSSPLSNASMEVLTVIAYNQPVSKAFIENVRGTDSSSVVNNLVEKGLVEEAGRLEVPGKPVVYRTTSLFLRCFGLVSLADLPPLSDLSGNSSDGQAVLEGFEGLQNTET